MSDKETYGQVFRFVLVGGVAFFIDGGILQALVSFFDSSPYVARVVSFSTAVIFTWLVNRRYSFRVEEPISFKEFVYYVSSQSVGVIVNVVIYSALVYLFDFIKIYPIVALIPATAVSMVLNFLSAKYLVFKQV